MAHHSTTGRKNSTVSVFSNTAHVNDSSEAARSSHHIIIAEHPEGHMNRGRSSQGRTPVHLQTPAVTAVALNSAQNPPPTIDVCLVTMPFVGVARPSLA